MRKVVLRVCSESLKGDCGGLDEAGGTMDDKRGRMWDVCRRIDPTGLDDLQWVEKERYQAWSLNSVLSNWVEGMPLNYMVNLPFEVGLMIFKLQMKKQGLREAKPLGPKLST